MDENVSFGYWVRRRRKALDLTQDALAHRVSCALSMVRKIEADEHRPSREMLEQLAIVLEIPVAERDNFRKAGHGEGSMDQLNEIPFAKPMTGQPALEAPNPLRGTVTFMLTDIEGSTRLWEQYPDEARSILVRHDGIIERIVATHGGAVIRPRGEGDSRFAVFSQATEAVAAAAEMQQALYAESWPSDIQLRVRVALHTGEATERDGDFYGSAVNRCARLRGVAHGGQILLSSATEALVRGCLPEGTLLRALGVYQLRDIATPEHIFQLVLPGLPAEFPPLPAETRRRVLLPSWPTPLIDRETETEVARTKLLDPAVRLLVMTGPGGAGKTRLAAKVAADVAGTFADGAIFVSLAAIVDPELVLPTIAEALDLKESGEEPLLTSVKRYLAKQHLLLVLDNFEQLAMATPLLAELLQVAPRLKLLVTSRSVLGIYGEHELPVPPLALPGLDPVPAPEVVAAFPAVELFLQRARAAMPAFKLTAHNAPTIAEICVRLDGLPLALELAAARTRLLPPLLLLRRLDRRLPLLAGGGSDRPARHRTLRNTIAWSYDLLDPVEQVIFSRLSIFVGGWSLHAAEVVITLPDASNRVPPGASVIDSLQSLLDKSLIQRADQLDDQPRFTMLETIREYGWEQLVASGESKALSQCHANIFLALAEAAELRGPEAAAWIGQLAQDYDNLRAALQWALDQEEAETAARLAAALWPFWYARSSLSEGRRWIAAVLVMGDAVTATLRTTLLNAAGVLAAEQGKLQEAQAFVEQSLVLRQELGDARGIASSLVALGNMAQMQGDHLRATDLYEQSLPLFKAINHAPGIASVLNNLGVVALIGGDAPRAMELHGESLVILRELGDRQGIASALSNLARVAFAEGDYARVHTLMTETLSLWHELGNLAGVAECLEGLASVAGAGDTPDVYRAARLWGAAEQIRAAIDAPLSPVDRQRYERLVIEARHQDASGFAAAWEQGRALSLEQAIAYALE